MLASLDQRAHHQAAKQHPAEHHQRQCQRHRNRHGNHGTVEIGLGLVDRGLLLGVDVLAELGDGLNEGRAAGRTVLVVHHVESGIVLAAQRLDHGVDAVIDIRAVAADQVHRQLAAGVVLQHVLLEFRETAAHARQQIGGALERGGGVARRVLATAPAGFLQVAGGDHQADAGAQHVAVDDFNLLGAFGQLIDLADRFIVVLQEEGSQSAHSRDQHGEERHHPQQHRADAGIAQPHLAFHLGRARGLFLTDLAGLRSGFQTRFHILSPSLRYSSDQMKNHPGAPSLRSGHASGRRTRRPGGRHALRGTGPIAPGASVRAAQPAPE
ncbi:Uncharacterised protein [Achromobacter xylosoxidans]|nr:Uncharacterised protein [Achromobacter xylosoxidans]